MVHCVGRRILKMMNNNVHSLNSALIIIKIDLLYKLTSSTGIFGSHGADAPKVLWSTTSQVLGANCCIGYTRKPDNGQDDSEDETQELHFDDNFYFCGAAARWLNETDILSSMIQRIYTVSYYCSCNIVCASNAFKRQSSSIGAF